LLSTQDLATAGTTKRPTCCVLVLTKPTKGEITEEVKEKLKSDYDQVITEVAEATSAMF
jgi:H/ACA ribonucleoprotein complex subunit 2